MPFLITFGFPNTQSTSAWSVPSGGTISHFSNPEICFSAVNVSVWRLFSADKGIRIDGIKSNRGCDCANSTNSKVKSAGRAVHHLDAPQVNNMCLGFGGLDCRRQRGAVAGCLCIVRPKSDDLHNPLIFVNLIDQAMLESEAP